MFSDLQPKNLKNKVERQFQEILPSETHSKNNFKVGIFGEIQGFFCHLLLQN